MNPVPNTYQLFSSGHRPKAVGVAKNLLAQYGFQMPESGVLDPSLWTAEERQEKLAAHKEKVRQLVRSLSGIPAADDYDIVERDFGQLTPTVKANAPIMDLYLYAAEGSVLNTNLRENSPVIGLSVDVLSIGEKTYRAWQRILNGARTVVILLGNIPHIPSPNLGHEHNLSIENRKDSLLQVNIETPGVLAVLLHPATWRSRHAGTRPLIAAA